MKQTLLVAFLVFCSSISGWTQRITANKSSFAITSAVIFVDNNETELVKTSAQLLQQEIEMVPVKSCTSSRRLRRPVRTSLPLVPSSSWPF